MTNLDERLEWFLTKQLDQFGGDWTLRDVIAEYVRSYCFYPDTIAEQKKVERDIRELLADMECRLLNEATSLRPAGITKTVDALWNDKS